MSRNLLALLQFVALGMMVAASACASSPIDTEQFKQFFAQLTYPQSEWRADDFGQLPSENLQRLLQRHQPTFFRFAADCAPMDFYGQYVPLLRLKASDGQKPGQQGSRELLKRVERNMDTEWELPKAPDCIASDRPPLYANAWIEDNQVQVLRYSFAFYQSGLPDSGGLTRNLAWLISDTERWHYLDLHGAVFYLLNQQGEAFAVVLAQHNHFRTFVIGVDVSAKQAKQICFAKKSNEPYLCREDGQEFKAFTAPSYQSIEYVITGNNAPSFSARDRVVGSASGEKIDHRLEWVSSRDPLKTSWAPLGPNLKIWGLFSSFFRHAPPGMDIFTFPELKEVIKTAAYFYFDPKNQSMFDAHAQNSADFLSLKLDPVMAHNRRRFWQNVTRVGIFQPSAGHASGAQVNERDNAASP